MLGYKVMRHADGRLFSGADARLSYPAKVGTVLSANRKGVYLSTNRTYVLTYYAGHHDDEVIVTLDFDPKAMLFGNLTDQETEIAVPTAQIVKIEHLSSVGAKTPGEEERDQAQQLFRDQIYAVVPRNSRTNLFPGTQLRILDAATDLELSRETAALLLQVRKPPYAINGWQSPWVAWAIAQSPAYLLLQLEDPVLRNDLMAAYLFGIYLTIQEEVRVEQSRYPLEPALACGILWMQETAQRYPETLVVGLCYTYMRYLMEGIKFADPGDYVAEQRSLYPGRAAYLVMLQAPDVMPLLAAATPSVSIGNVHAVGGTLVATLLGFEKTLFDVIRNPSASELNRLGLNKGDSLRGFILGDDLYVWPAMEATHDRIGRELNLPRERCFHLVFEATPQPKKPDLHIAVIPPDGWPLIRWETHPYFASTPRLFTLYNVSFVYEEVDRLFLEDEHAPDSWREHPMLDWSEAQASRKGRVGNLVRRKKQTRAARDEKVRRQPWRRNRQDTVQGQPMWNDPSASPEELVELAKQDHRVYANPNMPLAALFEGAEEVPWAVEQNPILVLLSLEDPTAYEDMRRALIRGWRTVGLQNLSPTGQGFYACDCAEHVLPVFEQRYPNDVRPRNAIAVARRFVAGGASRQEVDIAGHAAHGAKNDAMSDTAHTASDAARVACYAVSAAQGDAFAKAQTAATWAVDCRAGEKAEERHWQAARVRHYYTQEHPDLVVGHATSSKRPPCSPKSRQNLGRIAGKKPYVPTSTGNEPLLDLRDLLRRGNYEEGRDKSQDEADVDRHEGDVYYGSKARWLGIPGQVMKIDASLVVPTKHNPFSADQLATYYHAIKAGRVLRMPVARVEIVTKDDLESYQLEFEEGEISRPLNKKDIGKPMAVLTDGNHRAFAAILAGEPYIYVYVLPNHRKDVAKYLE